MNKPGLRCAVLGAALLVAGGLAHAQPAGKLTTVIVPFAPGGTNDIVARIVTQRLTETGKTTIVENRSGGGGIIGWQAVAKATPDGATLLANDMSFAIAAGLIPKLPFDSRKDFVPITTAATTPFVLVVNPNVPAKSVAELIKLAKDKPGKLNYGSGGNGTNTHLAAEMFKSLTQADIGHVPYKGAAQAVQDVLGGQIDVLFTAVSTALPHVKGGKLRALMVTDAKRSPALPDVPTAAEAGVPKMIAHYWVGFAAPAKTPPEVVARLNKEIVEAINSKESKERFAQLGLDPAPSTPAEAGKFIDDEIQRWSALIKSANIKAE
jgi:tripartite-type tricarboxylate transporter receptor subunit TctC